MGYPRKTIATLLIVCLLGIRTAQSESIPLERSGGVYVVPVRINDAIKIPFVLDSGAGDVQIPIDVFLTLVRTGSVGPRDHVGQATYKQANGALIRGDRYVIHKMA
jgi:hypothetical protein